MGDKKTTEGTMEVGVARGQSTAPCYPCRFCDERTPDVRCGSAGTFFVSMSGRHQFAVCDKHVGRYRDADGVRGRRRFDGRRYVITPV